MEVLELRTGSQGGSELESQGGEEKTGGVLDLFRPGGGEAVDVNGRQDPRRQSLVLADSLRCQIKITTRRQNIHLRIANHTSRDVFVRLVGRKARVSGTGVAALKEAVQLSQLEAPPTEAEQHDPGPVNAPPTPADDTLLLLPTSVAAAAAARVSMETSSSRPQTSKLEVEEEEEEVEESSSEALTISELVYSPCASMLPTPVEDSQGGLDQLFSPPVQSPAWLLRELHADPDIQAQLEAGRERDRAYERARQAGRSRVGGVLSGGLRLLSSNERVNACLLSVVRFVAVVTGVLLVAVPTLLLLLESDIDVSFLREIRQTPEFEQFHHEYYCPLRRWALCKVSVVLENLWSD